MSQKLFMLS